MQNEQTERRDRRKGLLVALLLHGFVVGACVYPFLMAEPPLAQDTYTAVEVIFPEHSAAAASARVRKRNATLRPVPERAAAPKSIETPAVPKAPAPPVMTTPLPEPDVAEVTEEDVPVPDPVPTVTPAPRVMEPEPETADSGRPTSADDGIGTASADGDTDGSPEAGDDASVADAGQGRASLGSALEGDGVLMRAVVYRPNLDDVIRENGVIALNLCINKRGRVIGVKWNEARSTITNTDVVRVAIDKTKGYRFERDMRAPSRECGTLSIQVKGL